MTAPREHHWHRPHFFSAAICRRCGTPKRDGNKLECWPPPNFSLIEKTLVDYFDTTNRTTIQEASEWYLDIEGRRISLSELAMVVAQELARP